MSENFASFEYKTQEEVLTVAKSLTSVLSTTGMQLVEILSPSHLLAQLHGPSHTSQTLPPLPASELAMDVDSGTVQMTQPEPQQSPVSPARCQDFGMLRSSVIVAMIMILKTHLKTLYGLSEEYDKVHSYATPMLIVFPGNAPSSSSERRVLWVIGQRLGSMNDPCRGTPFRSQPLRC